MIRTRPYWWLGLVIATGCNAILGIREHELMPADTEDGSTQDDDTLPKLDDAGDATINAAPAGGSAGGGRVNDGAGWSAAGGRIDAGADASAADGRIDAGADVSAAGGRIDAGAGASAADGRIDAGAGASAADGRIDAGADASGWECDAPNVFCDNFDQGAPSQEWTSSLDNLKSLKVGEAKFDHTGRDGSAAMHILLSGTAPSDCAVGYLAEDLEANLGLTPKGTVEIEFDFHAEGTPIYPFGLFCGSGDYQVSFNMDQNRVAEQRGQVPGNRYNEFPTTLPDPNDGGADYFETWRHIELNLNRDAGTISMSVNGAQVLAPTPLHTDISSTPCKFVLGVFCAGKTVSWDGYYDNVRIRVSR